VAAAKIGRNDSDDFTLGFMFRRLCLLLLYIPLTYGGTEVCSSKERVVQYEPASVALSGTVAVAVSKHPNGTTMRYPILRLQAPITVEPSSQGDPINSREACVKEVQLWSNDKSVHQRLYKFGSHLVTVTGTLFHGHTAWHMRHIVMTVASASRHEP
jgi:hypothetical protein